MNRFIVYKSSAGSGKTYTLVKEYLLLSLADKHALTGQYKAILAITFTNKAAAEMKWRIIKALREICQDQAKDLSDALSSDLHITSSELKARAETVLTSILHHYSDFSIGTIDSFTHRIIRTFALDLDLPANFQIETDVQYVFSKIISLLLNDLGKNKDVTDYLVQYALSQAEDNKNWKPEQGLLQFINDIYQEGKSGIVDSMKQYTIADFNAIKQSVAGFIKGYEQQLSALGEKALGLIAAANLSAEDFYSGSRGITSFFNKLSKEQAPGIDDLYNSTIRKVVEEDKWYGSKASSSAQAAIDRIKGELIAIVQQALSTIREGEARYNLLKLIYKNIYAMGLVNELVKLTAQFKEEENIVFISEFNERIAAVVNHEPTPFIYERLGDRYQHFLLDEFQDTSILQWQNILPLLDNSLANGKMNLIVGDGKQSIYRWRNANVEQFSSLPLIIGAGESPILEERQETLQRNYSGRRLGKNYRSRSGVITFNNALFDYLPAQVLHDDFKTIYEEQAQEHNNDELGYVTIDFAESELDKDEINCNLVHQYIREAVADGFEYRDVCVIVRRNGDGSTIANFLIRQGIPVVSSESLLLSNALEVNVLVSFLKYISNERDLVSASVVLNYLHTSGRIQEEDYVLYLQLVNLSKQESLFGILARLGITLRKEDLQLKNLYDLCVELSQSLGLQKANPAYLRFFLDEILNFLGSNTSNINVFTEWWERRQDMASVVIPDGMNAVSVMTIHKSKGLEFPVVITPYITWDVQKTEQIWVELQEDEVDLPMAMIDTSKTAMGTRYKDVAEKEKQFQVLDSLNMLYVDFTRAVDRLHIISPKPKLSRSTSVHTWLYDFAARQEGFDAGHQRLLWGQPHPRKDSHHRKGLPELNIPELSFNTGKSAVEIKGGASYRVNEDLEKARSYGVLVHYILSQVHTEADVEQAIRKAVWSGDLNDAEASAITLDVHTLMKHPLLAPYFSKEVTVKNEMEILTDTGEVLRPDRIVVQQHHAAVIDYKTGKKNPAKYHFQMKQYEEALRKLGYDTVQKFLVYIHEQEVEEII